MAAIDHSKLTRRQQEIFDVIKDHIETKGWPPTIREMMAATDVRSPNGIRCHLLPLVKKGYIEMPNALASRCIKLVGFNLKHVKNAGREVMKPALSPRQQVAFDFIKSHIVDVGWPPTVREIGDEMAVATNSVVAYLKGLVKKDRIETEKKTSRCIRLAGYRLKHVKVRDAK